MMMAITKCTTLKATYICTLCGVYTYVYVMYVKKNGYKYEWKSKEN